MALDTTSSPRDGQVSPPFTRTNTSSSTLYFDPMPSVVNSFFNAPRVRSRSSSPERGIKSLISDPIPTDSAQNSKLTHINGNTNMGDVEDDKNTLKAGGSTHADDDLVFETPQHSSPDRTESPVEMSRRGNDSSAYDPSSPSSPRKRSLSQSEDHHGGGATDETSLRSVPVLYTNVGPEGEHPMGNLSHTDVSRKASVKRSPSKLVKRRGTKSKQTEHLSNGSVRGEGSTNRRSTSRASQRSSTFRSSRGPVFDMITAPPNATISDAGGAFGTGAVMAAPENEIEDGLQSGFHERLATAESALTRKQTIKIHKQECASPFSASS
jgi:hypothetical protein